MTIADDSSPAPGEPAPWVMWLAHHRVAATASWTSLVLFDSVWKVVVGPTSPVFVAVLCVSTVALFGLFWATRRHRAVVLCDGCHRRTPLNTTAAVQGHRTELWAWHRLTEGPWHYLLAGALILVGPVPPLLMPDAGVMLIAASLVFAIALLVLGVIGTWHTRLGPWCPWCHDEDSDRDAPAPQPDPDAATGKIPDLVGADRRSPRATRARATWPGRSPLRSIRVRVR